MRKAWLLTLVVGLPALAGEPLEIVRNGGSAYSICIASNASPSERRGAEELQRFLQEISGARLPVVTDAGGGTGDLILVGQSAVTDRLDLKIPWGDLGAEGFVLKTAGRNLVIAGGRQRGTMYGVYTFLEKLGCRWFTKEVSRIPKMRTVTVADLDETQKPAFEYREPFFTEAFEKDWAARNKTNGAHSDLDESTGGKVQYYPFVHSFYQIIPPEKYFKKHPEYFSLIDGKRRAERGQLCLTNRAVLRLSVKVVLQWIREHPEAKIFSVSQNDWEGWCECDKCRRVEQEEGGAHSGPILRFVNAIAAEVEKQYPDKLIDTLAYWYSENPPSKARPRRNVRIRLCPIGVCEGHPYETCPRSSYFMRNLLAWAKITNQLYIWHYNTNFAHYLIPFPDFDELAADIPMYKRHGVVGLFLEGAYAKGGGGENAELRSYVMARLLWDPKIDVQKAIDEFHEAYYGKAAMPMRAYLELLHREVRLPPAGNGRHIWIFTPPDYSDVFLQQAGELFRQAERMAEDDAVRARVRKAKLSIDYAELLRALRFNVGEGWFRPADLAAVKSRFARFLAAARSFGITSLREGWSLDDDEREFASYVRPYRTVTLENSALRVDIAPELGGRVVRMIDEKTGRNVLRLTGPLERRYGFDGGLSVAAYPDPRQRPFAAKWKLEPSDDAQEVVLSGECENGLKLRQRIRLAGDWPVVRTVSVVENASSTPIDTVVRSGCDAEPADIDRATVEFRKADGTAVEKQLIQQRERPEGTEDFRDVDGPDGEWQLVTPGVPALIQRFRKGQAGRLSLSWTAKGKPRVSLVLFSSKRKLAPGERLELDAEYEVK